MPTDRIEGLLRRSLDAPLTYTPVTTTRRGVLDGAELPAGFGHLRFERVLGHGRDTFDRASACVLGWGMHRGFGFTVRASAPRAATGVTVAFGVGRGPVMLTASCRVVWSVEEPRRRGFGYGTLPGHPETGEEAFVVVLGDDDAVRLRIVSVSRPARLYSRLVAPAVPTLQRLAIRRYAAAVQRACA